MTPEQTAIHLWQVLAEESDDTPREEIKVTTKLRDLMPNRHQLMACLFRIEAVFSIQFSEAEDYRLSGPATTVADLLAAVERNITEFQPKP